MAERKLDQRQIPLLEAIQRYQEEKPAYFRIPGHRFERGISSRMTSAMGEAVFQYDLTEAEGLDDLHHPQGAILKAQRLAAELYKADRTWFLVNGTTCGNEAMILSAVGPGEKIIVPRNAHKSVLMGLVLSGAKPVWVMPEYCEEWGVFGGVSPNAVEEAFRREPDCKAAFVVSPTYYGICSDIKAIAHICHQRGALLLVDEAHGSHLYVSDVLPSGALLQGADMCSQSTHKTAGSLTQSSMLHCQGRLVNQERIDENLKLVMSTSPSYLLMTSLDAARYELALHGDVRMKQAVELAREAREGLRKIKGITVMEAKDCYGASIDPTRLVFSGRKLGLSGYEFQERLYELGRVSTELADDENVVAIMTWANEWEELQRLIQTTAQIAGQVQKEGRISMVKRVNIPVIPQSVMTPREAYFAPKKEVPWNEMVGKAAGEMVAPYPPGIPLIYPGERLTKEIYEVLEKCRRERIPMHGPSSADLTSFRVLIE